MDGEEGEEIEGKSGGQFNCAAEIASEMDFRKDSQRHFLRCKISARLLMGNSIAPLSFHLRWIFSKGAKSLDMSQNSARFSARFSAAQSNCAPECPKKVKVALLPLSLESLPRQPLRRLPSAKRRRRRLRYVVAAEFFA